MLVIHPERFPFRCYVNICSPFANNLKCWVISMKRTWETSDRNSAAKEDFISNERTFRNKFSDETFEPGSLRDVRREHTDWRKWIFRLRIDFEFHAHWIFHLLAVFWCMQKECLQKKTRKCLQYLYLEVIGKFEKFWRENESWKQSNHWRSLEDKREFWCWTLSSSFVCWMIKLKSLRWKSKKTSTETEIYISQFVETK